MKKGGLTKIHSQATGTTKRSKITKQSTAATRAYQNHAAAAAQSSFILGTSQSSASLAQSTRLSRQGGANNPTVATDTRRKSLQSQGFASQSKLGMGRHSAAYDKATGKEALWNQRPSNVTDQRSTAMHSGLNSPSTAMFKMSSINSRSGLQNMPSGQ